jgi:hypothetical protein
VVRWDLSRQPDHCRCKDQRPIPPSGADRDDRFAEGNEHEQAVPLNEDET